MYVLPDSAVGPQNWETAYMWATDPITSGNNPNLTGAHVMRFENDRGDEVELKLKTESERTHCEYVLTQGRTCTVLLTTDLGRRVEYGQYGSTFYDTTIDGRYVPLKANGEVPVEEIEELVDALIPATVDEWLDELERRSD